MENGQKLLRVSGGVSYNGRYHAYTGIGEWNSHLRFKKSKEIYRNEPYRHLSCMGC